ncbi:MAG: GtrA family protein [Chloroflexota bacterium]|nr:GtrA family protein [Chloroflexota bacterium]
MTKRPSWSALDEQAQAEASRIDPTLPIRAAHADSAPTATVAPAAPTPSYVETRWPLVNRALEISERVTHGRGGIVQRLGSYLPIGGTAALVNLAVFAIFFHFHSDKVLWYWLLANVVAYELSILANFIPNDYFTFRHLDGHKRSWLARCLRFHITSLSGVAVTFIISATLFHLVGLPSLVAQAIALILATAYNFTVHHLFTYSHVKR